MQRLRGFAEPLRVRKSQQHNLICYVSLFILRDKMHFLSIMRITIKDNYG